MLKTNMNHEIIDFLGSEEQTKAALKNVFNYPKEKLRESFQLPKELGAGSTTTTALNSRLLINNSHMICNKDATMTVNTKGEFYKLVICTGENVGWEEAHSKKYLEMKTGQAIFYKINDLLETCNYQAERYYSTFNIIIAPQVVNYYCANDFSEKDFFKETFMNFKMNKFTLPLETKMILQQILNCPYQDTIKKMYLEAKTLELFSLCLNEIRQKDTSDLARKNFSKTEIASLYEAKEILDHTLDRPISLRQLGRRVYLNEYKLKSGFKALFGKPIYAYQLDKRMALAQKYLTIDNIAVNKVAQLTGYANSSSFSKAFCKKYGVCPKDCINCKLF